MGHFTVDIPISGDICAPEVFPLLQILQTASQLLWPRRFDRHLIL